MNATECLLYIYHKPNMDFRKIAAAIPDKRLTDPVAIMSTEDMMDMDDNYADILGQVVLFNS